MALKHSFKSLKPDPADATVIGATKWNDDHYYVDTAGAPAGNVGAIMHVGALGIVTHVQSAAGVLTCTAAATAPVWTTAPTLTAVRTASGIHQISNSAGTDLTGLILGGTDATGVRFAKSGNSLHIVNGDNTAYGLVYTGTPVATSGAVYLNTGGSVLIKTGNGTPEGVVAAAVGSLFLRLDGGTSTTLYVKQTGAAGNTGWVAK